MDACKSKGINEKSKERYTLMNKEKRKKKKRETSTIGRRGKEGGDKCVCVCLVLCT